MKNLTKYQELALTNIENCFRYEVRGWTNCVEDNNLDTIPNTLEEAIKYIYDNAVSILYTVDSCTEDPAPGQMRFAGKQFMLDAIEEMFTTICTDEIAMISIAKHWDISNNASSEAGSKKRNTLHNRGKQFEYNGESHTLLEWSRILGIGITTLHARLYKLHWPMDKVFMPKKSKKKEAANND